MGLPIPFSQQAARTVRDVLVDSLDALKEMGLRVDTRLDRLDEGGHEIEIVFHRDGELVDVAAALIGSDETPRVTLDELREWTSGVLADVLDGD